MQKVRMTREGCRVTTVARQTAAGLQEEIILQAEDLVEEPLVLGLQEEDTGRWLIAGL